jgi:hypothetical protein
VRGHRTLVAALLCTAALLVAIAASTATADVAPPRVTLIGDSVMTGMLWHNDAIAIMQDGLGVDWQVAVCRRLVAPSCPFEGQQAPTLLDVVQKLDPNIAPIVVVEVGYNDSESLFTASVETSIQALLDTGAQRILWLNLRAVRHPYVRMNAILAAEALKVPQLTIVDWNRYSRSHPDWFQTDYEHLREAGGVAMATLVHAVVMDSLSPPLAAARKLPTGRVGEPYSAQLTAQGGTAPYRWRLAAGKLPKGLELMASGRLAGVPRQSGRASVSLWAMDADGLTATSTDVLSVGPAR